MDTFQLNILAASSVFYEGECESLVVPTPDGKRGVLAHHSNAIAAISPGELSYTVPGEKPRLAAVSHGMIKIEDNHVLVLVETAEKPEDIDRIRNQQNADAAREALLQKQSRREYLETWKRTIGLETQNYDNCASRESKKGRQFWKKTATISASQHEGAC